MHQRAALLGQCGQFRNGIDHAVGVAGAHPFDDVRSEIERRREEGLHGGMQFTFRNPARSTDPPVSAACARAPFLNISRYAIANGAESATLSRC